MFHDISVNILKPTVDIHFPHTTNIINFLIKEGHFPDKLKFVEVSLIFKKKDVLDKDSYRPVSVLPQCQRIERIRYHQRNALRTYKLSKQLTRFFLKKS